MTILQTKSRIGECENLRRIYQNIDSKIGQKKDELANVNNDWREAAFQKLSASNKFQRALLSGALTQLINQKQRLEAEIRTLDKQRNEIRNDYSLRKCTFLIGSIG